MQQKPVLESQLLLLADLVRADVEYHFPCGEAAVNMCVHGQSRVDNVSIVKGLKAAIMIYYWFHQIPLDDVVTLRRGTRQRLLILTPSEILIFHSSHVLVQQTKGEVSSSRSHFPFRFYDRLRLQLRPRPGTKALPYLHRH